MRFPRPEEPNRDMNRSRSTRDTLWPDIGPADFPICPRNLNESIPLVQRVLKTENCMVEVTGLMGASTSEQRNLRQMNVCSKYKDA